MNPSAVEDKNVTKLCVTRHKEGRQMKKKQTNYRYSRFEKKIVDTRTNHSLAPEDRLVCLTFYIRMEEYKRLRKNVEFNEECEHTSVSSFCRKAVSEYLNRYRK
jgi:hypothetical protein